MLIILNKSSLMATAKQGGFRVGDIQTFLTNMFQNALHAKRIPSLANATLGVMVGGSLIIHGIGQGLAEARGLIPKHAIKQVDRLLSTIDIDLWTYFVYWVPQVIGRRKAILVALDWTDYAADGHATIALPLVTSQGRATPLLWKTVNKATLAGKRNKQVAVNATNYHILY